MTKIEMVTDKADEKVNKCPENDNRVCIEDRES